MLLSTVCGVNDEIDSKIPQTVNPPLNYAGISIMHAPYNCAPPVPRSDAPSIMHPHFSWEIQRKSDFCRTKIPFNYAPPAGEATSLQLCRCKLIWGGVKASDQDTNEKRDRLGGGGLFNNCCALKVTLTPHFSEGYAYFEMLDYKTNQTLNGVTSQPYPLR